MRKLVHFLAAVRQFPAQKFKGKHGKLVRGCQNMYPFAHARRLTAVFLGVTISGMRHRCRLRSETGWAEFGYFKMVAPSALVFRPLVKGNEDSGNEIG